MQVYRGYVDDPRNTDNSWMETIAVNFHDDSGNSVGRFNLHAGERRVSNLQENCFLHWKLNFFAFCCDGRVTHDMSDFPTLFTTGDDAVGVRWTDIHQNLKLYASHANFIRTVAERHGAHW